ncbi:MAG: type II toxin-antitoxin system prevent-host-death family antitoxin [Verrucomicrobia bacterium]|nr:type II toxin-antitoxin system prevent-host-death family antitoxin [Verrucomicrobiota bacterium]
MPVTHRHSRCPRAGAFVGAFHAKTHFSQLLERVAKGEEITITKHDHPVARLVPADRPSREHVATIFRRMDAFRQSLPKPKGKESLRDLISEGRRF